MVATSYYIKRWKIWKPLNGLITAIVEKDFMKFYYGVKEGWLQNKNILTAYQTMVGQIRMLHDYSRQRKKLIFVDVVLNLKKMMNVKLNHLEMHKFESYEDDASSDVLDEWTYHEYSRSYQTRNGSDEFISKANIGFK